MEIEVGLVGQIRNEIGVAAGFLGIGVSREQRFIDCARHHLIRVRIHAFHLIVDDAVPAEFSVLALQFVSPALLPENLLLFVKERVEDRVEIDIHEVLKVLRVAARDRVDCPIRIGHRIQEGVERALHKLHKRLFDRILLRAAEHGVLDNMGDAGRILRRRPEADRKDLVRIVREQEKHARTGLLVREHHAVRVQFLHVGDLPDLIGIQPLQGFQLFFPVPFCCHISSSLLCMSFTDAPETCLLRAQCSLARDSARKAQGRSARKCRAPVCRIAFLRLRKPGRDETPS